MVKRKSFGFAFFSSHFPCYNPFILKISILQAITKHLVGTTDSVRCAQNDCKQIKVIKLSPSSYPNWGYICYQQQKKQTIKSICEYV